MGHAHIPVHSLIEASHRPEVVAAMNAFYIEADRRIAELPATCWNKGECCRFGQYGHRLYVTSLEVAYYLAQTYQHEAQASTHQKLRIDFGERSRAADCGLQLENHVNLPVLNPQSNEDSCPHAYEGKCHARNRRPLGCRIFYCDPLAQHWQGPLTEELLAGLRTMHEKLDVPYLYADWMVFLSSIEAHASSGL